MDGGPEILIPIVAIIGVFFAAPAAIVLIVWLVIKERARKREREHAEKMAMIQQGMPVAEIVKPEEEKSVSEKTSTVSEKTLTFSKDPEHRLVRGITTAAVGAAITLYALIIGSEFWMVAGLIPLAIGVSIIPQRLITRGLTTTVIGVVLTIWAARDIDAKWLLAGLILLFIGLSRIAIHFMMRRREKEPASEETSTDVITETPSNV
jgi:hypothetical protein